jgi:protein O-mannosyl-transferase
MDRSKIKYIIIVALILATLAVYWKSLHYDFVNYDDPAYVTTNDHIKRGFTYETIVWAFTTTTMGNWNPLTWLSHIADYSLYGLDPTWHRLTNVFFHIVSTILLFLLFQRTTGNIWRSAIVAALFALHPLRVESVVWISERKDVLSTFLFMLTLLAYVWYVERPGIVRYLAVVILFVLGLMAKPMLVTLPVVLLLLDYWPLNRFQGAQIQGWRNAPKDTPSFSWLLIEKGPLVILSAAIGVVTILAQRHEKAMMATAHYPFLSRLLNAFLAYVKYLGKIFWPTDLAVLYPLPEQVQLSRAVFALLFVIAVTITALALSRRKPFFLMGWLWFLVTLMPVIGIIQVGLQSIADRYTYIPSIGIAIVTVWGISDLLKEWHRAFLISLSCAVITLCITETIRQTGYWENSVVLFSHTLNVTQNNRIAHVNLGDALDRFGRYEEAISHYQAALRIKPDDAFAYYKLANDLDIMGQTQEAIRYYRMSLQFDDKNSHVHNNLGIALMRLGDLAEAKDQFSQAIRLDANQVDAHYNLGLALSSEGRFEEAMQQYAEVLRIYPSDTEAKFGYESAQNQLFRNKTSHH